MRKKSTGIAMSNEDMKNRLDKINSRDQVSRSVLSS